MAEIIGSFNVQVLEEKELPTLPGANYFVQTEVVNQGMPTESSKSKLQKKIPGTTGMRWGDSFHYWVKKLPITVAVQIWEARTLSENTFIGQVVFKLEGNSQTSGVFNIVHPSISAYLGKMHLSYSMVLKPGGIPPQSFFPEYSTLSLSPVFYTKYSCVEFQGEISDLAMLSIYERLSFCLPPVKISDRGFRVCWQIRPTKEVLTSQRKSTLRIQNVMLELLDALSYYGFDVERGDALRMVKSGKHAIQEYNKILYLFKKNTKKVESGKGARYYFVQALFNKGYGWIALLQVPSHIYLPYISIEGHVIHSAFQLLMLIFFIYYYGY
eukprot:TRINITY_DN3179_c0_g2_i1.p1 TRINITY_DN3179_c0_g2~~TRINITY_DN3179_c0_g2_i1.p1  ORF type:complete len:326 (+),score=40.77 TRINITY_DN3179_c0_g2_i1:59-1036(+)